ncbi:MAG: N-(5'-phosphoribosyl)anthranilate isomerase, partial [Hyphomicrobiales bacterium]|nr:N-(5'-phosphoribosyl)anthranilate isomerase [Hyphomicrobiales bacterium]
DWRWLADYAPPCPWLLAGGLTADNVAEALRVTRAPMVDVASGVEDAPGRKSAAEIFRFVAAARKADHA